MGSEGKGSVSISGAGKAGGGVYEKVSISGAGKITGDVEAETISISGSGEVEGSATAASFGASGAVKVREDVKAGKFRSSGAASVRGNVSAETVHASGAIHVGGSVKARQVQIAGGARFGADVEAEEFRSSGAFEIQGLLNADKVEIVLRDKSWAREIGGELITVVSGRPAARPWRRGRDQPRSLLHVETIEGDDVYPEATDAKVVRGRTVAVGPGCKVQNVEYSQSLRIDPDARVDNHEYTGTADPPPSVDCDPVARPPGWAADHADRARDIWGVWLNRLDVPDPVMRILGAALALLIAAAVIGVVLFIVLPAVHLLVTLVLGGVGILLLALAIGLPAVVLGRALLSVLLLPFRIAAAIVRRILV